MSGRQLVFCNDEQRAHADGPCAGQYRPRGCKGMCTHCPLPLLITGSDGTKCTDPWVKGEGLCLVMSRSRVSVFRGGGGGNVRLCVAPTGQSSENMTLKAAESLERLGSLEEPLSPNTRPPRQRRGRRWCGHRRRRNQRRRAQTTVRGAGWAARERAHLRSCWSRIPCPPSVHDTLLTRGNDGHPLGSKPPAFTEVTRWTFPSAP